MYRLFSKIYLKERQVQKKTRKHTKMERITPVVLLVSLLIMFASGIVISLNCYLLMHFHFSFKCSKYNYVITFFKFIQRCNFHFKIQLKKWLINNMVMYFHLPIFHYQSLSIDTYYICQVQ